MSVLAFTLVAGGIFCLVVAVLGLWGLSRMWRDWPKPRLGINLLNVKPPPEAGAGETRPRESEEQ
jgi:hypothetical protein